MIPGRGVRAKIWTHHKLIPAFFPNSIFHSFFLHTEASALRHPLSTYSLSGPGKLGDNREMNKTHSLSLRRTQAGGRHTAANYNYSVLHAKIKCEEGAVGDVIAINSSGRC